MSQFAMYRIVGNVGVPGEFKVGDIRRVSTKQTPEELLVAVRARHSDAIVTMTRLGGDVLLDFHSKQAEHSEANKIRALQDHPQVRAEERRRR